jgi:hypothetical protein
MAPILGCTTGTVLNAIHAFQVEGLNCLQAKSCGPKHVQTLWPRDRDEELRELLHQTPRVFGKKKSIWTLGLIAEVWFEKGITPRRLSIEGVRVNLARLGINWKRARPWMTSPDPHYAAKKARRDRLMKLAAGRPDWALGFEDEVWWSRVAQPKVHAWTGGPPMKVHLLKEEDNDPDPVAICCYGMLRSNTGRVALRFVRDRPIGEVTIQFLSWVCQRVTDEGKKLLIVVWDEASWHRADAVSGWVREYNDRAKRGGEVRLVICELPVASPWLNNIEPCWTHARKAIMEPDRKLTAQEITSRVCEHFGCELLPYLGEERMSEARMPTYLPAIP